MSPNIPHRLPEPYLPGAGPSHAQPVRRPPPIVEDRGRPVAVVERCPRCLGQLEQEEAAALERHRLRQADASEVERRRVVVDHAAVQDPHSRAAGLRGDAYVRSSLSDALVHELPMLGRPVREGIRQ